MKPNPSPPETSRRRWFQFSLRTLLVAMLVVAAYFGGRIPVLRDLETMKEKMNALEKQAAVSARRAEMAQQQAELQRLIAQERLAVAENRMQATMAILEKQRQEARPPAD